MKKILLGLAGLFLLVVVGLAVYVSQIDVTEYQDQALAEVEKVTGRKVSIDGELDIAISLTPSIVVEGIRIANADWASTPDMLSIKRLEIQVSLMPLLGNEIDIQKFILVEPALNLEKNKDGKGNWELGEASAKEESSDAGSMAAVDIGKMLVRDLKLSYLDGATGKKTDLAIDNLDLETTSDGNLDLKLKASLDGNDILVQGTMGSLESLFENDNFPVDLAVDVGALALTLKGSVSKPMEGKGLQLAMTADTEMLSKLNPLAGSELPEVGPFSLKANLSDENNVYNLGDLALTLADTSLSGNLSADISGDIPSVTARLKSQSINLVPFQPEAPEETEKVERYLSDEPIPLDGLKAANADISLDAAEILTRQAVIQDFSTRILLDNGRLNIKPLSMNLAGGKITGNLKLDGSTAKPSLVLNLDGKKVNLGQLEQMKETLSGGSTDITLRLSGQGNSSQAIAGSANGKLLVQVGEAQIAQEDKKKGFLSSIAELLNPFSKEDNAALQCAVINFNIKDGIATANKGIGVETKQISVSGAGQINLKNEQLALGFEPSAKGAVAGTLTNLASGMKAEGTLANPKIKINPAGVAMGAIKSVAGIAGGAGDVIGGLFGKKDDGAEAKDTAPCNTALTGKPTLAKTSTSKTTTEKATTEKSTVEATTEKVMEAPKKLLKGLFE